MKTFKQKVKKLCQNKKISAGASFLIILLLAMYVLPSQNPYESSDESLLTSSWDHLLGTDTSGFDLYSRVLEGGKISLKISFFSILISMLIGSFLGVISGYFGGIIDNIINFVCDILVVVPDVILAILLLIFLPNSAYTLVIVLSITNIPSFIRLIRGKTLSITEKDFIKSAEALGATKTRIIFKHIAPNLRDTLITRFVVGMSTIILTISGLGFIGLGVDASKPEWGNILGSAKENIRFHPHIFYGPFIIISLTSLSFNLIGKGLITYFDPKQKK